MYAGKYRDYTQYGLKRTPQFQLMELALYSFLTAGLYPSMIRTSPDDQFTAPRSDSTQTISRRAICRGVAVMALPLTAGCSALSGFLGGDPGEVTVFNDTGSTITVTTTVTNLVEETEVLSDTADIAASDATKYNDVFESATRYRFEAETADGLSESYEWDLPSTDHYLYITIGSDSIDFEENSP